MSLLGYLGSPYSKYRAGLDAANDLACWAAAELSVLTGITVLSPIAATHHVARLGKIDPRDHKFWMRYDRTLVERSDVLFVLEADGWKHSRGLEWEMSAFAAMRKPIFHIPETHPLIAPAEVLEWLRKVKG